MVDTILRQLDSWYNEPSVGSDRPKLLSKLAVLELCGWIEGEFDRLAMAVESGRLNDLDWVKANVISRTSGFTYSEHWRPMLVRLVGEVFARRVEVRHEQDYPGELDLLRSSLGSLWRIRCEYAHADMVANVAAQQTFNAPSWSLNQHRLLKKYIARYEQTLNAVLSDV